MRRTARRLARMAILAASIALAGGCADPDPKPEGRVELLAAWDAAAEGSAGARVLVRITCGGELGAGGFGVTVRVDSGARRYWGSVEESSALPAGASTTRTVAVPFAAPEERMVAGSAAVDSFWLE